MLTLDRAPERQPQGYPDEKGFRVGAHVNRGEAPAEMEDTSAERMGRWGRGA